MHTETPSRIIRAEPLSVAGFAPFGMVADAGEVDSGRLVNQGRARRIPGIGDLSYDVAAKPVLDFYRIAPSTLPFAVTCMERHPLSSQVFVPTDGARYLVVVAAGDRQGRPDLSRAVAFIGDGTQIIHYRRGTWHAPMIALDTSLLMTMLMWEVGDARDCEEFRDFAQVELRVVE